MPPGALLVYTPSTSQKAVRKVVGAGANAEQARGKLGGLRGGVEGAVIGQRLDAQRLDLAVLVGRDFSGHVVVAREPGGLQVLGTRLDPLHRHAKRQRRDHRADISRINGNLVAEAAADIRERSRGYSVPECRPQWRKESDAREALAT